MTDGNPSPGRGPAAPVLANSRIARQDDRQSFVHSLAINGGHILATGDIATVTAYRDAATRVVEDEDE